MFLFFTYWMSRFRPRFGREPGIVLTPCEIKVLNCIIHLRAKLINLVAETDPSDKITVRIRLVYAILEYTMQPDLTIKKKNGENICILFSRGKGGFPLPNLDADIAERMKRHDLTCLERAQQNALQLLIQTNGFMEVVDSLSNA